MSIHDLFDDEFECHIKNNSRCMIDNEKTLRANAGKTKSRDQGVAYADYLNFRRSTAITQRKIMKDVKTALKDGTHILGYGDHFDIYNQSYIGFCEVYYDPGIDCWLSLVIGPDKMNKIKQRNL